MKRTRRIAAKRPSSTASRQRKAKTHEQPCLDADRTVLLLLSEVQNRQDIESLLATYSYEALAFDDTEQALAYLDSHAIGCVIAGIDEQEHELLEFIRSVREHPRHAFVPLIALSDKLETAELKLLQAGVDACCKQEQAGRLLPKQLALLLS